MDFGSHGVRSSQDENWWTGLIFHSPWLGFANWLFSYRQWLRPHSWPHWQYIGLLQHRTLTLPLAELLSGSFVYEIYETSGSFIIKTTFYIPYPSESFHTKASSLPPHELLRRHSFQFLPCCSGFAIICTQNLPWCLGPPYYQPHRIHCMAYRSRCDCNVVCNIFKVLRVIPEKPYDPRNTNDAPVNITNKRASIYLDQDTSTI